MFERFTCWDSAGATKILRPLALEGNEAVFRATHSPISGLVVTGTEAHDVSTPTEQGVLDALSFSGRRHAMCVVEGEAVERARHRAERKREYRSAVKSQQTRPKREQRAPVWRLDYAFYSSARPLPG